MPLTSLSPRYQRGLDEHNLSSNLGTGYLPKHKRLCMVNTYWRHTRFARLSDSISTSHRMSIEDEAWEGLSSSPKRKRDTNESGRESIAKKPKKKKRSRSQQEDGNDPTGRIDLSISQLDPQLLADLLAKQTKRFAPDLSLVELEDRRIPGSSLHSYGTFYHRGREFAELWAAHALVDTTQWSESRSLDRLPDFLKLFAKPDSTGKDLAHAPPGNGTPHTIVVAGSAIRAAGITRYGTCEVLIHILLSILAVCVPSKVKKRL